MNICGQCKKEFDSEEKYLKHKCEKTGFKPIDMEHLGEGFKLASKYALARGEARQVFEAQGLSPEEAIKKSRGIGTDVI